MKRNRVHIGKAIKQVYDQQNLSVTDFAVAINKSRTVVYDIFERATIDTALLQKIAKTLDFDFFLFFTDPKAVKPLLKPKKNKGK